MPLSRQPEPSALVLNEPSCYHFRVLDPRLPLRRAIYAGFRAKRPVPSLPSRKRANPATVPGAPHIEPARGSVARDMMWISTMTQTLPPAEVLSVKSLITPTEQGIASRILAKNAGGSLTLFAFDRGQGLTEHTSPFEALVLVLEGSLTVTIGGTAVRATPGTVVFMPADIPHALDAAEPCRMLLFMLRDLKGS